VSFDFAHALDPVINKKQIPNNIPIHLFLYFLIMFQCPVS